MIGRRVVNLARSVLPESIKGAISNCGGVNRRHDRFAGHLASQHLSDEQFLAICNALILPNGVRKTTGPARNEPVIRRLIDGGFLTSKPSMDVLEVGASAGLDAVSTYRLLRKEREIGRYVLGDLHVAVLYDRERGLVFDEDGHLLQIDRGTSFVSMNFSFAYQFQRYTTLPKRITPWRLRSRYAFDPTRRLERLPLVHPSVRVACDGTPFELRRMDVFETITERFDLIVCLHLLVSRYFSPSTIAAGIENLSSALEVGGTLVVGSRERFEVIRREGEHEYSSIEIATTGDIARRERRSTRPTTSTRARS